jgi:hypothetical protein
MVNGGRIGFQEGGDIRNVIKEFEKEGTTPSSFAGPRGIEFKLTTGRFSGKPVYKPIYPKDYDFLKFGAIGGGGDVELDPDYFFKHIMAPEGTYFDIEKNDFLPVDSTPEVPTVDPFSGQQVSAQEQASFIQPQDIFPQQELPTVTPEAPFQPYQAEPSNVGIFAGPSYDKYNAARTDAYANAPSKFDYDVTANQAAGQFIQDRAREIYGDNIFGKGIGTLGAVAGVPLAMFSSPFHEAAQVVMEGRMKPSSGIEGFYKSFMNELPFSTAANRAAGVMRSIPGVGEPIYQGAYKLGEGLANLTSKDPVLSSLTKNFNNLTLQEMDKIRNTSREQLIREARSAGQEGGMGYLLGF